MLDGRWVEVSPSQFDHEKQGLDLVKSLLPDASPYRAWSNFEFRDNRGRWHEVDLLVLARDTLYLVELKSYAGTLRGNDHVWTRGGRSEDSPLLLARRKAQYFASHLKEKLAEHTGQPAYTLKGVVPYVQEAVFLHHPNLRCELSESSKKGLYGLDGSPEMNLPGISQLLLAPPRREPINEQKSEVLALLMAKIGLAPRRQREVGSWIIDDEPLADGEGWQDWPAFHHVDMERRVRIRFYLPKPGATSAEDYARVRAVEHEYRLLARLRHDGLQTPADVIKVDGMGIGLVFDQPCDYTRLDLYLADHAPELSLDDQLVLLSQIGDIVQYAHRHRVVHRMLGPRSVSVRVRAGRLLPLITDWDNAGVLPANAENGVTRLSSGPLSVMDGAVPDQARLFAAPEGRTPNDPARLDVFGLGALTFYLCSGGTMPATERGELMERLRRDRGLDLSAELPQVPSPLRQLVLDATNPSPSDRIGTIAEFLDRIEDIRKELVRSEGLTDPLAAGPGTRLDDRFEYLRRLGAGSTAVGILVVDHKAGGAQRVLKVAKDDDAAARLQAEASVLGRLQHDRIVTLNSEETVGGRAALVLQYAGRTTLAEELAGKGGRLSIDLLERWGTDLLTALIALERAGVMHRDVKPSNLGVWSSSQKSDTHLMMFDFSMAGVDPRSIEAGSPPYLDPFLGTGERRQYDSAAERYGAGVVLFEMATGRTPQYGPDPEAHPATAAEDVTLEPAMFDSAVAGALTAFFTAALSREVAHRHDTAEDMLRAWRKIFTDLDAAPTRTDAKATENATVETRLADAGLSARAVSALATLQVTTVGELLALDSTKLNRLVAKETKTTRGEIRERYREWKKRLGAQRPTSRIPGLAGLDDAVDLLLASVSTGRAGTRRDAADLLLGTRPGLDAFASGHELAQALGKTPPRGHQLIKELQENWAATNTTRELLEGVLGSVTEILRDSGGAAAISTLISEVRALLPTPPAPASDAAAPRRADRAAAGILRAAFDRLTEHEAAEGEKQLMRRRHDGRLAVVATDEIALAAAESAARRADELVTDRRDSVVSAATATRELRSAYAAAIASAAEPDNRSTPPSDQRLVRLAAAISRRAAVSGRGELHTRFLEPSVAVRLALAGLSQSNTMTRTEVRDRVAARFPELDRLPTGPALDAIVARAGVGLEPTDDGYRYPDVTPPGATSLVTRGASVTPAEGLPDGVGKDVSMHPARLDESIREHGFLAIGVTIGERPGVHLRVAEGLRRQFGGAVVDVTGTLIDEMRECALEFGVDWDLVRSADAAASGSQDAQGLQALLTRVLPPVLKRLHEAIFDVAPTDAPLILTEVSPLARYDRLSAIARWSDLAAPRRRPVWLILPQLRRQLGPLVDGKTIQLSSPGRQFVTWNPNRVLEKVE